MTFLLAGCGDSTSPPQLSGTNLPTAVAEASASGTRVDPAIVAADNAFGLGLLRALVQGSGDMNVAISPISVSLALQIAYNGAAGATQQAMAQTLQLGALSTQQLNDANAALQASLIDGDSAVTLNVANSLWMHLDDNPVLPSFTQMDETYYGATIGNLSGAPANVNSWIADETHGLITQVLPPGNYSDVVAVLANVIYFKAQWTNSFDPSLTVRAPFETEEGSEISVEMMHQSGSYPYLQGPNFQAVRIPYGSGRFSMLILLPESGTSLASVVDGITPALLTQWVTQMQVQSGTIALPRFTATFHTNLNDALATLGMGVAFCPYGDLSGVAPLTCIGEVDHASFVQVDESGTVAAGATTVTIIPMLVAIPGFTMTMDRPFLYAVLDSQTGELLFVGALEDPT